MDEQILEQKAIKAAISSNWSLAAEINESLLNGGYETADVYNRLGKAYSEMGEWKKAINAFENALKIDPVSSVAQKGLNNAKMNRKAGVTSSEAHKETLLRDLNTTQIIELKSDGLFLENKYKLVSKNDFFILVDETLNKQVKRISKLKLNLKQGANPNELFAKVLEINNDVALVKLTSNTPVFKAEKQQIDPTLELEEKDVESEKKEIERMYREEE